MFVERTVLPGVLILTPRIFGDDRGCFFESFNIAFSQSIRAKIINLFRTITANLREECFAAFIISLADLRVS